MDVNKLRQLFPVTKNHIFLNNAAESPLNLLVKQKIDHYLNFTLNAPHNKPLTREAVRERLAQLLGGASDEYALVTSTGMGLGLVARGFKWNRGDNIILPSNEHWNNSFPWQALEEIGVELRFVHLDSSNRINPAQVQALTDENTKIIAIAAVSFNTGFRADLQTLGHIAHENGALLVVDGIQGVGVIPIDVETENIDVLCSAGFKWLLGVPGTGFMYINKKVQHLISPIMPGMFSANLHSSELEYLPDARRYETGSLAYSLFYGWSAGLDLLKEIGIKNIHERVLMLTDQIISGLQQRNISIVSPIEKTSERSAIIVFTLGNREANEAFYKKLIAHNIIVTLRHGLIRISPSFYNNEEEISSFLNCLPPTY